MTAEIPTDEAKENSEELFAKLMEAEEAAKETARQAMAGELGDAPITPDGSVPIELTPEMLEMLAQHQRLPRSWYTRKIWKGTPEDYARRKKKNKAARRARKMTRIAYRGR